MIRPLCTALVLLVAAAAAAKPPSWDKQISGKARFAVLKSFDSQAVLDKETGLVWERSPSNTTLSWEAAIESCTVRNVGGRLGWRLARIEELLSLVDPTYSLPADHPFAAPEGLLWTATTVPANAGPVTSTAWIVSFGEGPGGAAKTLGTLKHWCVRGGAGIDDQ